MLQSLNKLFNKQISASDFDLDSMTLMWSSLYCQSHMIETKRMHSIYIYLMLFLGKVGKSNDCPPVQITDIASFKTLRSTFSIYKTRQQIIPIIIVPRTIVFWYKTFVNQLYCWNTHLSKKLLAHLSPSVSSAYYNRNSPDDCIDLTQ